MELKTTGRPQKEKEKPKKQGTKPTLSKEDPEQVVRNCTGVKPEGWYSPCW